MALERDPQVDTAYTYTEYEIDLAEYKHKQSKWEKQHQSLTKLVGYIYETAKQVGIAEVSDTRRAYRDFLLAISETAPVIAQMNQLLIETVDDIEKQLLLVIEQSATTYSFMASPRLNLLPHIIARLTVGQKREKAGSVKFTQIANERGWDLPAALVCRN
ncbi:MAG: hypothetical protein Q9201_007358 [Fulgogasparrea decipioides]